MGIYALKVVFASGICYAIYEICLARKKSFLFNRVYLITTLLGSIIAPLIKIPVYVSSVPENTVTQTTSEVLMPVLSVGSQIEGTYVPIVEQFNLISLLLPATFTFISTFLFIQLIQGLIVQFNRIKKSTYYKHRALFVTHSNVNTPYSFFHFLYLPIDMQGRDVPDDILRHEECHSSHYHTLDLILFELVKVIFWFNPFLYLYRRAIRDNHEYTADQYAVGEYQQTLNYIDVLMGYATKGTNSNPLSLSFTSSSTKKRIKMITSLPSKPSITAIAAVAITVLCVLVACTDVYEEYADPVSLETVTVHSIDKIGRDVKSVYLKSHVERAQELGIEDMHSIKEYKPLLERLADKISNNPKFYVMLDNNVISNDLSKIDLDEIAYYEINGRKEEYPENYDFKANLFSISTYNRSILNQLEKMKIAQEECEYYDNSSRAKSGVSIILNYMGPEKRFAIDKPFASIKGPKRSKELFKEVTHDNRYLVKVDGEEIESSMLSKIPEQSIYYYEVINWPEFIQDNRGKEYILYVLTKKGVETYNSAIPCANAQMEALGGWKF